MVNKFELDAASAGRVEKKLQALESQNAALNKEVMKHIKDVLSNKDTGKLLTKLKESIDKHAQSLNKKEFDGEVGEESLDNVNFDIDDKSDRDNFLSYLSNVDRVLYQEFQLFFTELDQLDEIKIQEQQVVTKNTEETLSTLKTQINSPVVKSDNINDGTGTENKDKGQPKNNTPIFQINSPVVKPVEEKKSDTEGFNQAPTLQEVVVVGKKKTPENSSPVKPQLPEQQAPVAPEKELPSTYESQELSSHINYELKGHEFIISGERFDITTDEGMTKALAVIAAGGNLEKAKTLRKNFKGVNLKDFDTVMGAVIAQWPEKMTIRALKKIAKANGYDRKGAFLGVDAFKNDYRQMGMIFSALGKEGVGAFYAIRTSKVDIKEVANTVLDKKNNDLTKISSDNVFDYLVDRNGKAIQGKENVTEVVGEKSLLDTIIDMSDRAYTADKSKKVLIDGPKTAQVIEAAIMHIDGRGRLNGAAKKQFEVGEKVDGVGVYNLANFAKLIKENPVFKVYYNASLVDWVANKRMDLHDVVRKDTWEQKMFAKEDANGSTDFGFDGKLNTLNTEQKKWFENYLKNIKDPDAKKWFDSLDAEGKKSFMYALTKVFQKTSFITSIIGIKAEDGKPFNEKTLMDAVEPDFKWFKDEGGKGPRIVPMFRFKKEKVYSAATGNLIGTADLGRDFFIGFDMPIVSAGMKVKVNRGNLDKAAEEEVKSLNSIYGHLSAHTSLYIGEGLSQYLLKKENRQYLKTFKDVLNVSDAQLGAIVQADLGFAKDYNAGIEYVSNKFADRLQMLYEVPSGITTLEQLKEAFAKNLTKAKKEFKSYDKENQGRLEQYQQVMLAILEASPVFAYIKNNPKASTDLNAVMKGIAKGLIAENEKEKMQAVNGETKLTKIGLLGRAGLIFDLKTLADPNGFKDMIKNNAKVFGAGLQYSLTSFLVKYAPDKEKYEYMDASLKEGKDISRIDGLELADGVEKIAATLEQSMNVDGMIVRVEKGKLVFALDPEHPVTTAEGYAVTSITQLLNIYVDTKNEKNVALAADGKSLIVGDASALGYVNRNYCNDQSHYLIIGKGGVNGKTWVHKSTDLPTPVADVKEIKTDVFTEAGLKKALMEDPSLTGTLEQKKALVESIVPAYLTIDGKTHEYKVNIQGKWVVFDHKKNGLNISCDKAGKCEQVEITDKVGKVFFEQAEYIREEAPKSSDILSENGREIYKVIKEELFTNVDFGPLVSKYKSNAKDTEIKKAYESLVKGDHTTAELIGLLKLLQTRIAADKGKYVAGDIAKVNGAIDKIITKITGCDSLDCKLIVNVFMSKLPQSVGHTAKSGEFIAGGKMEKIFAEGYNHKGKKLDAIKKMKLPEYVTTHINRVPSFTNVMKNAGLSKYTNDVLKNHRATLLNKNPNATSWEVKQDANLLMFNANMTPGVDEFNLIPPGEAMIAHVNGQEMISEINNPAMEEAVLKMLSKEQFGGYKALLEKKYNKKFSDKEVQDFVAGREITVNGKSVRHDGKGLVFAFYGGCFNESLGFEIGKIVEKVKVEKISGSVVLKDLVGMEFNTDAQTVTMTPYLNSRTITHTIGADLSEKVRKTNAGSNGGGNGNGDGDSNGGGGGTGGGGSGGGGGTGGGGGSGGGGGNGGGSGGNGGGGGGG